MTQVISDERLREILAGCEGVTPGPWEHGYWSGTCHKPSHAAGKHPGASGADPCVYDPELVRGGNGVAGGPISVDVLSSDYDGLVARGEDLAHIARLDPNTVRSIITELLARRSPPAQEGMVLDAPAREGGGEWEALQAVVSAWAATKAGDTTVTEIQRWLIEDMKPAIDAARRILASSAEPAAHSLQTLAPASDAVKPGDET